MNNQITGFHIEPTNICTLKCPGCARTRFIDQWPQHWRNHSLDTDELLRFFDLDLAGKDINFCGNYGDPIYHPDLIGMVRSLKSRGAYITIITNGSYKKQEWWEQLADGLTPEDSVVFSVDGTPENFMQYRVNANWPSIQTGMEIMAKSSCNSIWKYIPFSFNQTDIKKTEELSKSLGIKNFQIDMSDRFDQQTEWLKPDAKLIGARYIPQSMWKSDFNTVAVSPKCSHGRQHFITADGYYTPCCFLADHRFYYKTPFGKNKSQYDIRKHTFTEIMSQTETIDFYDNLDKHPGCKFNCPKISIDQ